MKNEGGSPAQASPSTQSSDARRATTREAAGGESDRRVEAAWRRHEAGGLHALRRGVTSRRVCGKGGRRINQRREPTQNTLHVHTMVESGAKQVAPHLPLPTTDY